MRAGLPDMRMRVRVVMYDTCVWYGGTSKERRSIPMPGIRHPYRKASVPGHMLLLCGVRGLCDLCSGRVFHVADLL